MKNVEMGFAKCTEKIALLRKKKTKENATKAGKRKMLLNLDILNVTFPKMSLLQQRFQALKDPE